MVRQSFESDRSVVSLVAVHGDVRATIRQALDAVAWKQIVPHRAEVALKVNPGWDLFIPGSITSPLVTEALILELREHVGKIYADILDANLLPQKFKNDRAGGSLTY